MSTDDCTTIDSKCPCGNGTISVEQCTPDHPWARSSQTSYSAALNCESCSTKYQFVQRDSNSLPTLVLRSEVQAQNAAIQAYRAADKTLLQSPVVQSVIAKIIQLIDSQPSKAATHRVLQKIGLSRGVYGTYIKSPYGGAEAVKYIYGSHAAEIGLEGGLIAKDDVAAITDALANIKKLRGMETHPKPIKTGATWMSH